MPDLETTTAELTPFQWQQPERAIVRAAILCAVEGQFPRMEEHLRALPAPALADLRYALDVMHPIVGAMAGVKPMADYKPTVRHQSIRVPCGRCGHDEQVHGRGDADVRLCLHCDQVCAPRVITGGAS